MGFDFFADLALREEAAAIDQVVNHQGRYIILKEAGWTIKCQVLATGKIFETKNFPENDPKKLQTSFDALIKNGRAERKKNNKVTIEGIGGYPELVRKLPGFPPDKPLDIEALCSPNTFCLEGLPDGSCLLKIEVRLERPFSSRDDLAFYPHENPLKREWVFQTPYLAASGIKGLLRWAWRMHFGDTKVTEESTLFGPRNKGLQAGDGQVGCIQTWPVFWKGKVGLEVINPHDRQSGAGINPVKYEVMKPGATASLWLLIMNRQMVDGISFVSDTVLPLLQALSYLLAESGISAKRSADWGAVSVLDIQAWLKGMSVELPQDLKTTPEAETIDPWRDFMDSEGNLFPLDRTEMFIPKILARLSGKSEKQFREDNRPKAIEAVKKKFAEYKAAQQANFSEQGTVEPSAASSPITLKRFSGKQALDDLIKWWEDTFRCPEDRP